MANFMAHGALLELLSDELSLRIESGQTSARNLQAALRKLQSLDPTQGGVDDLLSPDRAEAVIEAVLDAAKRQAKPPSTSTLYSLRSNLRKLAGVAREIEGALLGVTPSGDTASTICIEGYQDMPLGQLVKLAVRRNYENSPVAQGRRAAMQSGAVYIQRLAFEDLAKRSRGKVTVNWLDHLVRSGAQPRHAMRERLVLLERMLRLDEGVLSSRAKASKKTVNPKYQRGKRAPTLTDLPLLVKQQWEALVEFHTVGDVPATIPPSFTDDHGINIKLRGSGTWRVKIDDEGNAYCQTAEGYLRDVRYYLSWLHFEHGVPLDDLDLSLLCHDKLVEQYKRYKRDSAITGAKRLVIMVCKLLKEQHAYLSRYHAPKMPIRHASSMIAAQYPSGIPVYKTAEEWARARPVIYSNCLETQRECEKLERSNRSSAKLKGVGSKSNIQWVLNDPLGVVHATNTHVWAMINTLSEWSSDSCYPVQDRIKYGRAAAFYAMALNRPIRAANAACLKVLDTPCKTPSVLEWESVWVTNDGDYRFYIPKARIKNETGREVEDVDFTVIKGSRHHRIIKRWLDVRRKLLKDHNKVSPWFLIKGKGKKIGEGLWRYNESKKAAEVVGGASIKDASYEALQAIFRQKEIQDRDIKQGINPHAVRHIVAHYILEKTTNDYALAAHALMDSVDTIIKTYGKNHHAQQSRKLDDLWRQVG